MRRLREQHGVVLVEAAIVLPILILVVLGIIYFGRYEDYSNQETQLAESAARYAAVAQNPGSSSGQTLQQYVQSTAQGELLNGDTNVAQASVYIYCSATTSCQLGNSVTACVSTVVQYPFFGFAGTSSTIAESATMRIEQNTGSSTSPAIFTPDTPPASADCPAPPS